MVLLEALRSHPLHGRFRQTAALIMSARRPSLLFSFSSFILLASFLFGGGTRGGFLSDTIIELLAIPVLLVSLSSLAVRSDLWRRAEWPLLLCAAIIILPLLHLVPLPPWIWTRLPQHKQMVAVFDLLGGTLPWLPMSVSPTSTWLSLLALLAPAAIFIGVVQLSFSERRTLSVAVLGFGVFAAVIGLLQVAQGPSSPFRFFTITSDVEAVGFFANRNHFAAFLYSLILVAAAWTIDAAFAVGAWKDRKSFETSSIARISALILCLLVLITVEAMTRSRAGLALMIVAVAGAFMLAARDKRRPTGITRGKLIFGGVMFVFLLLVQFGLYRLFDRFAIDPLSDARVPFARNTIRGALAYMPFGSGIGTFVSVYPTFEPAQDTIANVYANHAHNDWLEVWLEGGVTSMLLVAAFLVWFSWRAKNIWLDTPRDRRPIDILLVRAGTVAIPLLLVHCLVDYPLRTGAMMAFFAFWCGLLIDPLARTQNEMQVRSDFGGERRREDPPRAVLPQVTMVADREAASNLTREAAVGSAPPPTGRWGEDIDWPDQWRK